MVRYPLKTRCCGGSLTGTLPEPGLLWSYILLKEATERGADVIATVCPLCQFNLDCYRDRSPVGDRPNRTGASGRSAAGGVFHPAPRPGLRPAGQIARAQARPDPAQTAPAAQTQAA